jgi:uncharacterized protein YdeI (BOF family)
MRYVIGALAAFGTLVLAGCGNAPKTTLGSVAEAAPTIAVRHLPEARETVTLRGTMVEKCGVAACWFRLKDDTGIVKVDLAAAGFTVTDVPVNASVVVTGKPRKVGEEFELDATGLRY